MMLVVFAGGGTGGHIYPGIAVAEELLRRSPEIEVEFWISGRDLEKRILAKEDVPVRMVPAPRLPGSPLGIPRFLGDLASCYLGSRRAIKSSGAVAVVGLGGAASFGPVRAAAGRGVVTLLLEQNVIPGRANVHLAPRASLVCLSWPESQDRLPRKARSFVTGNPLRAEIVKAAKNFTYAPSGRILILGGSTGAVGLNNLVMEAVAGIGSLGRAILHQTGQQDFDRVSSAYREAGVAAEVVPFIDDMAGAYASAGMVISRAGGTALSEIALFGLPAVLVPYPHHKDYHQMANARVFTQRRVAEIIEEGAGAGARLAAVCEELAADRDRLRTMHAAALALGKPDAAEEVAKQILSLAEGRFRSA